MRKESFDSHLLLHFVQIQYISIGESRASDREGRGGFTGRSEGLGPLPWIGHCFYIPYHFDMIFTLLLCISPWKQQHLTIRVNIQVTNQPFLLYLEEPSNTLNLLFWQRLFAVESLATRITACSSHLIKNSKKYGWKTSVGQQVLLILFLVLCRPPGLQPKLGFIVLLVANWSLYSRWRPDMLQTKEDIWPWSPTYRMILTFLSSIFFSFFIERQKHTAS